MNIYLAADVNATPVVVVVKNILTVQPISPHRLHRDLSCFVIVSGSHEIIVGGREDFVKAEYDKVLLLIKAEP